MGNPNVGKSVIFTRMTGVKVIASNYPGTTVEFCHGCIGTGASKIQVIDVPGTYSLEPSSPAELVASAMLDKAMEEKNSIVVDVIDSTNLERNLNLTLQLVKKGIPMIIALNLWDEAKHIGITIDTEALEQTLGVPVVPTVAITGEGIKALVSRLVEARQGTYTFDDAQRWHEVGKLVDRVQVIKHKHHTLGERIGDLTIHPWTGIPFAVAVLLLIFALIRFIGEGIINAISNPFFEELWKPLMMELSHHLGPGSFVHKLVIGQLIEGTIDFGQSFGILTTGLYVPFGAVLPYIFSFYLALSILEDTGYLPRLAVLLDNTMHLIGLHGMALIPMFLACGCNVPGVLATRVLETRRERFIAATLMSISIPCMAQIAMIFGLLGKYGAAGLLPVFTALFIIWLVVGNLMRYFIKGESPEIFTEIPSYRLPHFATLMKKVWMRVHWFLKEAIPFVLLGVFIVNMLYALGIISFVGNLVGPVTSRVLGLPFEAVSALIIGFLRKDLAVGMLAPLGLTVKQLIVACVLLTVSFPCIATFAVLLKELGIVDMFKAALIMLSSALTVGILLNLIL